MKEPRRYTSKELRQDSLLLRNDYACAGEWDMPIIKRCDVDIRRLDLIASDHIRENDTSADTLKAVHFFVEDEKLDKYYYNPDKYIFRLSQYAHVLTPDYSQYTDMPMGVQIYSTFKNRWCGAFWQEHGLSVIPTVSWSTAKSFKFCFDGLEYGSVVAVSTLGGLRNKNEFLAGYEYMRELINPKQVLCFGRPFREMGTEVVFADYLQVTRRKR